MNLKTLQRLYRAFSDGTRLRILHLLILRKDLCVCDMMAVLKLKQPKISRHLAYLRRSKLVTARREGLWSHYSLNAGTHSIKHHLFDGLEKVGSDISIFLADEKLLTRVQEAKKACK